MKWYTASDHAGVQMRRHLLSILRALGDEVEDFGPETEDAVDYPDQAIPVARAVASAPGSRGLLICGTGVGIAVVANKVAGIRCAVVGATFAARASREHNDANILALGARVTGLGVAEECLRVFRDTPFEPEPRHLRRLAKLEALERGDV